MRSAKNYFLEKQKINNLSVEDRINYEMKRRMEICRLYSRRDECDISEDVNLIDKLIFNTHPIEINLDEKILDPAYGRGSFLFRWHYRLFNFDFKTKIIDPLERDIYIRTKTLWGIDIEPAFKDLLFNIFPNLFIGNYLDMVDETKHVIFNINNKPPYKMKPDIILTNPPYHDGNRSDGQNKLYNEFSKRALETLKDDGIITSITPISVTRKSKRFSIIGIKGLKEVDFSVNKYFSVGQTICSWTVDKTYFGDVKVICENGDISYFKPGENIFDKNVVDLNFIKLYDKIRNISEDLSVRMFQRNNFGDAFRKTKDTVYKYQIYKKEKGKDVLNYHSSRLPHFYKEMKFLMRLSGSFKEENVIISKKDYDMNYIACNISKEEIKNIKSFLFSEYFVDLIYKWKTFTASKSYDLLVYLPKFDKTKYWTNEDVKQFFEKI